MVNCVLASVSGFQNSCKILSNISDKEIGDDILFDSFESHSPTSFQEQR